MLCWTRQRRHWSPRLTATSPVASTTRRRLVSKLSRSRAAWRSSTRQPTPTSRSRAIFIKEERCELVKHHLWVLWTDYFKPDHLKQYPNLNDLFWMATKSAGEAKKTTDIVVADRLLAEIDDIAEIFWATKK